MNLGNLSFFLDLSPLFDFQDKERFHYPPHTNRIQKNKEQVEHGAQIREEYYKHRTILFHSSLFILKDTHTQNTNTQGTEGRKEKALANLQIRVWIGLCKRIFKGRSVQCTVYIE